MSALLSGKGASAEILRRLAEDAKPGFVPCYSEATLEDFRSGARGEDIYPARVTDEDVSRIEALIRATGKACSPDVPVLGISLTRDSKDDRFLTCAQLSEADYLVSHDKDELEEAGAVKYVKIVRPSEFLRVLRGEAD